MREAHLAESCFRDMTRAPAVRYFTGKPCPNGHVSERYASTRACVACADVKARKWQKTNRKRYLRRQNETRLERLFGVTPDRYSKMLRAQKGGCAICGGPNSRGRKFAVDHDHSCCSGVRSCGRCVRGLLCDSCNHGLGKFRDDPALLLRAARYIENAELL